MNENIYFVANSGCDATTYGLIRLNNEDFAKFKSFIENLNKNSYYSCMPTISVYKISVEDLKVIENISDDVWEDDYVDRDMRFYLDDKIYTFKEKYFSYYSNLEQVIGE